VAVVALAGGNSAPAVGNIVVSPTTGLAASTIVRFSATATDKNNDPITFAWDFGDGATSTGAETTHTFANAGTFTVKVTANDGKASGTNQTTVTIRNVAGTWRSNPVPYIFNGVPQGNMQWVFTITQSLAILNGSLQASGAIPQLSSAGTVTGLVGTGTPAITLNGSVPGWQPPTFTLDPNTDITTLTGRWIDAGGTSAITFTRQ
jgi:PKD repeat protein